MAQRTERKILVDTLDDLSKDNFKRFCRQLVDRREEPRVRRNRVEDKDVQDVVDVLISTFKLAKAPRVAVEILREIGCNNEADLLVQELDGPSTAPGSSDSVNTDLMKPGSFNVSSSHDIISPPADESELGLQLEPCDKLEDLQKRVWAKEQKKRALARLNLCLGEGVNVAVGIYATAVAAQKQPPITLHRETNKLVRIKTRIFHSLLLPRETKKAQMYGKKQIVMERDEVDAIEKFEDPGLSLIGFKPMEKLKIHHHIRPAVFLYPEESEVKGSACLFSALLTKCSERNVFALCRYVSHQNYRPRFVALVPQKEEVDEGKVQITPPGFNVIFLPYADDMRTLDPPQCPTASQIDVDKMKKIVSKLRFEYRSDAFENPVIRHCNRYLEALALDMIAPVDTEDPIKPNEEKINNSVGDLAEEFKRLVYPPGYNPESKQPGKRKTADAGGGAEKKPKVEVPEDELRAHVQNGTLGKLTVPVLKEACKQFGVRPTGTKKQELIDALTAKLS